MGLADERWGVKPMATMTRREQMEQKGRLQSEKTTWSMLESWWAGSSDLFERLLNAEGDGFEITDTVIDACRDRNRDTLLMLCDMVEERFTDTDSQEVVALTRETLQRTGGRS